MRNLFTFMAAITMTAAVASAQYTWTPFYPPGPVSSVAGIVENVNTTDRLVTISDPQSNRITFFLGSPAVIVSSRGRGMFIGELQSGQQVEVNFTGTLNNATVYTIIVRSAL